MIDVHCHLEQKDYEKDRDEIIEKCKKELKAVITCCCHPDDFDLTMEMVEKYRNFKIVPKENLVEELKNLNAKRIKNRKN